MAWAWRKMPWFDWFFTTALASNDLGFVSDQRILLIDVPVLILHAEDDAVVPHKLGKALHDTALNARDKTWPQVNRRGRNFHQDTIDILSSAGWGVWKAGP